MSLKLIEDFPGISSEEWRDQVLADLKGADFDQKLLWRTSEGFNVQPYYLQEDIASLDHAKTGVSEFPYIRGSKMDNTWMIRQNFTLSEQLEELNKNALDALKKGANALGFKLSGKAVSSKMLGKLLSGITPADTCLHFTEVENPLELYDLLFKFLETNNFDPASLKGSLGADPLGELSLTGELSNINAHDLAELIKGAAEKTPHFKIIGVNPYLFQDGGSTLSQELGFGLSMANEYLDQLIANGCTPNLAMKSILFSFACGPNYFMEIAKLRAARWLWSIICKEWGVAEDEIRMTLHAQSARWNLTVYDPYVNVLRSTTESMSASLAGADFISIHPYDAIYNEENEFSARISRNLQIVLKEEAYFDKVADPAAGSYYIETLTDQIAEQAWKIFRETEQAGGYSSAFKLGMIQEQIEKSVAAKKERSSARKDSILGVSQYPNFNEMMLDQAAHNTPSPGFVKTSFRAIAQFRIAEDFEALRLRTEKSGKRPKVFMLKYGDPVWRTARAMFAGNFFAVAGYEIIDKPGFNSIEEGLEAAKKSGSEIVVLCSSDTAYAEIGTRVYTSLKDSSETVIAGFPKDCIKDLQQAGMKHFIHVRSNLLDTLTEFNNIMGIK